MHPVVTMSRPVNLLRIVCTHSSAGVDTLLQSAVDCGTSYSLFVASETEKRAIEEETDDTSEQDRDDVRSEGTQREDKLKGKLKH